MNMPTKETYMFEIYYFSNQVVRELFNSFEEAKARINQWPWPYNMDNCAAGLWKKIEFEQQ